MLLDYAGLTIGCYMLLYGMRGLVDMVDALSDVTEAAKTKIERIKKEETPSGLQLMGARLHIDVLMYELKTRRQKIIISALAAYGLPYLIGTVLILHISFKTLA